MPSLRGPTRGRAIACEHGARFSLSPLWRGEGWGEGQSLSAGRSVSNNCSDSPKCRHASECLVCKYCDTGRGVAPIGANLFSCALEAHVIPAWDDSRITVEYRMAAHC